MQHDMEIRGEQAPRACDNDTLRKLTTLDETIALKRALVERTTARLRRQCGELRDLMRLVRG